MFKIIIIFRVKNILVVADFMCFLFCLKFLEFGDLCLFLWREEKLEYLEKNLVIVYNIYIYLFNCI